MTIFGHACRPSLRWLFYCSGATSAYHNLRFIRKQFKLHVFKQNHSRKYVLVRKCYNLNLDFLAPTLGFLVDLRSIFKFCHQLADQNLDCRI